MGCPRSDARFPLWPLCRSYINTRLVSERAGSEHHKRFKSSRPALTPGVPVPAVRRRAGGQPPSPAPRNRVLPGGGRDGDDTQSRTDVTPASRGPSGLLHLVSTLCNTTCGGAGTAHACTPRQPNRGEKKEGEGGGEEKEKKKKGSNLSFESFSLKCSHGFIRICSHRGFEEHGIRSETSGKIRINENIIPKTKGKINPALPLVCSTAFPQLVTLNLLNRPELSFPFSLSLPY